MASVSSNAAAADQAHQTRLQNVQSRPAMLNAAVQECITAYGFLGLRYHSIPSQSRALLYNDPDSHLCIHAFIGTDLSNPLAILTQLKDLQQTASTATRTASSAAINLTKGDAESFDEAITEVEDILEVGEIGLELTQEDLQKLQEALQMHVQATAFFEDSQGYRFEDAGLPTEAELSGRYAMLERWEGMVDRVLGDMGGEEQEAVLCAKADEVAEGAMVIDGSDEGVEFAFRSGSLRG